MSVKLIGLDLDKTTLNSQRKITDRTRKALEEAAEKGIHVVIATGRSFYSMPQDVYSVKGLEFSVNSNGAEIRELKNKNVIYRNCISPEAIDQIHKFLSSKDYLIEVFTDGRAYIEKKEYEDIRDYKRPFRARDYVVETRNPVENLMDFMYEHRERIENINIFFGSDQDKNEAFEDMQILENVTLTSSMPDNLEIGGKTTSKASALDFLAQKYNILPEEVMCCGDSLNDSAMLEYAGYKVAMGNACEEIKAIANYHTDSNDEDGVAKAIEHLALGK